MKKSHLIGAFFATVFSLITLSSHAALVSRLGGQAVYDTDLDITWLADANLANSNSFGVSGIEFARMTNNTVNTWITAMNADGGTGYLGFDDWRLPTTLDPDASCTDDAEGLISSSDSLGWNCTGGELGHLFYNELGGIGGGDISSSTDADLALFSNILSDKYWTSTETVSDSNNVWFLHFNGGVQNYLSKDDTVGMFAWAVRPGDVNAVPVPSAVWLFGSGLLGLVSMARRKKAT